MLWRKELPVAVEQTITMKSHLSTQSIPYTGQELRSHWAFETFGILGDVIVSFAGPCEVALQHMVDLVDVAASESIRARLMQHFLVELFDTDLDRAVLRQRLLVALAGEALQSHFQVGDLQRKGDDLFVQGRKLSVSIATASAVSTLIHLGINIDPTGAPVAAIGLAELGVDPSQFAQELMAAYVAELDSARVARCKVRPVP